jgi:2-amino-4-hydroxy-6-hydroxymethyldihydropteridine diphosphokinase
VLTHTAYLSLGSNLGDRQKHLDDAIAALAPAGVRVQRVSSMYETEPVDYLDQPWFLNCVVQAQTELDAEALLRALRNIETLMGRTTAIPKGPRVIDLDILLYGDQTIRTPELQVPHPRMLQRRFVLAPLAEIAPNLRHPSWDANASELLARTPDASQVRVFRREVRK